MTYLTPDIANKTKSQILSPLDRVGMEEIQVPINLQAEDKSLVKQIGQANAYVDLVKPEAKGIHMSRLFIHLQEELSQKPFSRSLAKEVLGNFLESHNGLSHKAFLTISYQHPMSQKSLLSPRESFRAYPVSYEFSLDSENSFDCTVNFSVLYSSTCPCSAALSRQALQEKFKTSFPDNKTSHLSLEEIHTWLGQEENMAATPHSQRSKASLQIKLHENFDKSIPDLITLVESSLKTSVQSIVKREDEKEFAKLNATNLMFAEDAARRLKKSLSDLENVHSYSVKVCHYESLHAHNAVAYASS